MSTSRISGSASGHAPGWLLESEKLDGVAFSMNFYEISSPYIHVKRLERHSNHANTKQRFSIHLLRSVLRCNDVVRSDKSVDQLESALVFKNAIKASTTV